jgi:hypothetical protein
MLRNSHAVRGIGDGPPCIWNEFVIHLSTYIELGIPRNNDYWQQKWINASVV